MFTIGPSPSVFQELLNGLENVGVHILRHEGHPRSSEDLWLEIIEGLPCEMMRQVNPRRMTETTVSEAMDTAVRIMLGQDPWDIEPTDEDLEGGLELCGTELLGFYRPFHWGEDGWGIYLNVGRIVGLGERLATRAGLAPTQVQGALLYKVIRHEWHHYVEEIAISHVELIRQRDLFRPWMDQYRRLWPDAVENEALANAKALVDLRRGLGRYARPVLGDSVVEEVMRIIVDMMRGLRGSYGQFGEYVGRHDYRHGLGAWLSSRVGVPCGPEITLIAEAARLRHNNPSLVPLRYVG